jgi:hypothetical protein
MLLGGFDARLNGRPVAGFTYNKMRALLAYLAVERVRDHNREALAALLWGDNAPTAARDNLRRTLSNLRRVLELPCGEVLFSATKHTIRFIPNVYVDTLDFAGTHPHPLSNSPLEGGEHTPPPLQGEGWGGDGLTFAFKHALIQEAAYQSQAKAERQAARQRIEHFNSGLQQLQLLQALYAMGNSLLWTGQLDQARLCLERSIALYHPSLHETMALAHEHGLPSWHPAYQHQPNMRLELNSADRDRFDAGSARSDPPMSANHNPDCQLVR